MAIVVDPDLLNREEIIFGTTSQQISAYPVGAEVSAEQATAATTSTLVFTDTTNGDFVTDSVAVGDILSIKTGADAGHWAVAGSITATSFTVESLDSGGPADWADTGGTGITYTIRQETGGNMADGATEQAVYSFSKEEWRSDSATYGGFDLIQYEFPFEPLTREQFEIGGGTTHDNWDWFTDDTRFRVRTGGWDQVNTASTKKYTYSGVITLGTLEADAQVYYQPSSISTAPVNFVLPGAVNQAVQVHDVDGVFDTRTYFKIFVRKKGFTYAQSEIGEIGVTTLENIVNRFPLTHTTDPAIVASDAELEGTTPWTGFTVLDTDTNGVTADVDTVTGTLTSTGAAFDTNGIAPGDVVYISAGATNDGGYFEIITVDSATVLTLDTTELGGFTGESSLTYATHDRTVYDNSGADFTDGVLADGTGGDAEATLTSATAADFAANGVAAGDIMVVTAATNPENIGYWVIKSVATTTLTLEAFDYEQPDSPGDGLRDTVITESGIEFHINEPGMYLMSKEETVTIGATTTLAFADADPDTITRAGGDWQVDGVLPGDVITITGSASNNGSFTVATVGTTALTLVASDVLVAEGAVAATATCKRYIARDINGELFAFKWVVEGNDATAANVYQFIQREMRATTDIDVSDNTNRGDVTDLLMSYQAPTGKGLNMFIDNLNANDTNNVTFEDAANGTTQSFDFVSAGTINFNTNLVGDAGPAVYTMFFADANGNQFGTDDAIIVDDADDADITGTVPGASRSFTFAYDSNVQGGRTQATDADIVIVAIGLETAQYVLFEGTITRATGITFSLVSALERNYSNP